MKILKHTPIYVFKNRWLSKIFITNFYFLIKKNLDKFLDFIFENELDLFLEELSKKYDFELRFQYVEFEKHLENSFNNNKYKIINKLIYSELDLFFNQRAYIYETINKNIAKYINRKEFINFILNNSILHDNHQLFADIIELSFQNNEHNSFKVFFNIAIQKYYKNHIILTQEGKYNYLIRSLKEKKDNKFFELIIEDVKNLDVLINVLFNLKPEEQERLNIIFNKNNNKEKILKRFEEIKIKNQHRSSDAINRVNKLLNYKKISNF